MRITFLGHAGLLIETKQALIVADPWLSQNGAFDGAWYQYPRNHHLAPWVREKLSSFPGERYIYVSHEHQDHLDRDFLESLDDRDFTLLIAKFTNDRMERSLQQYRCRELRVLANRESIAFGEGTLTMYVDDTELNRDSGIFVRSDEGTLFNMNDCKLFDALPAIRESQGSPDVFTCQYSGAIWHPICYEYDPDRYAAISKKKYLAKFEAVARAIDILQPKLYFPSAGPPCFLDPELAHLNSEPVNIFPNADKVLEYLSKRLQKAPVPLFHALPGDRIEINHGTVTCTEAGARLSDSNRTQYLKEYADSIGPIAQDLRKTDPEDVFSRLTEEFQRKLERFAFASRIDVPLYVYVREVPDKVLKVDFTDNRVEQVRERTDDAYYSLTAPAWELARVLDRKLTWDEFGLTFRVKLRREPDVYQPFLYAFLILEIDTIDLYCRHMLDLEANDERIIVKCADKEYSILRYCPHMGADLSSAYLDERGLLTCPRHRWQFDLSAGGQCTTSAASICAQEIERSEQAIA